jgi:hypothetical protein
MHLTALAEAYKHVVARPFGIGTFPHGRSRGSRLPFSTTIRPDSSNAGMSRGAGRLRRATANLTAQNGPGARSPNGFGPGAPEFHGQEFKQLWCRLVTVSPCRGRRSNKRRASRPVNRRPVAVVLSLDALRPDYDVTDAGRPS